MTATEEVREGWHRHLNGGGWVYGDARVSGNVSTGEVTL